MLKPFILFFMFEPSAGQTALYHMEFSSRQACDAARVSIQAKAKQPRPTAGDAGKVEGKPVDAFKIIDMTCLEK
jgi:hypothetical protein